MSKTDIAGSADLVEEKFRVVLLAWIVSHELSQLEVAIEASKYGRLLRGFLIRFDFLLSVPSLIPAANQRANIDMRLAGLCDRLRGDCFATSCLGCDENSSSLAVVRCCFILTSYYQIEILNDPLFKTMQMQTTRGQTTASSHF